MESEKDIHIIAKTRGVLGVFSCLSMRDKLISLAVLSVLSAFLAVCIDYVSHLVLGPTSLGALHNPYWIGFFFVCGVVASAFFVFRHDLEKKPERVYLTLVLLISCFSCLAYDTNKVSWDVDVHYQFMLEWSALGSESELSGADAEMAFGSSTEHHFALSEIQSNKDDLNAIDEYGSASTVQGSFANVYNKIASFPAYLVYFLCSLFSVPFTIKYVLSRLIYAVIYSLVTYFGMRMLSSGKMLFAVIALFPTCIFLASNYNYDYWINAFILLAGACLVRELQTPDERITKKRIALLFVSFALAMGPKAIYFPLILLCLLLPKKKFSTSRGSKSFRVAVVFLSMLVAISFLVPYLIAGPGMGDARGGSEVNSTEQIKFILSEPFAYANILFSFLLEYISIENTRQYIAFYAYLGFSSWPTWLVPLFLMVFTALTDKGSEDGLVGNWKSRLLSLTIFVVVLVLVATALYVSYTAVRSGTIAGCQPRYIIPTLFLLFALLGTKKLAWPKHGGGKKTAYNSAVLGSMGLVNLVGVWQVYVGLLY